MAGAPEHRGGFLTRRRLLLLTAGAAFCAAGLWLAQARLLSRALTAFSGGAVRAEASGGSAASGYTLYGLRVDVPGAGIYIPELFVRPGFRWTARPYIKEVRLSSPTVTLAGTPAAGKKGGAFSFPAWLPRVEKAAVSGGRVEFREGGPALLVPGCALSYKTGALKCSACTASYQGLTAAFSGKYAAKGAEAAGSLRYPAMAAELAFDYSFGPAGHSATGGGSLGGAPVSLAAGVKGKAWNARLTLRRFLPLELANKELRRLPLTAARVSASGTGFSPAEASGTGDFALEESTGVSARGTFRFRPGAADADVSYSSGALAAVLKASLSGQALAGDWKVSASSATLPFGGGLSLRGFKASGELGGVLAAPSVKGSAALKGFEGAGFKTGAAAADFSFTAGKPERFEARLSALAPEAGGRRADSALAEVSGSRAKNIFKASVAVRGSTVTAAGSSSLLNGRWRAEVASLEASAAPAWRLCGPFAVDVASGAAGIGGFCAAGAGRVLLSGTFRGAFPEELHFSAEDLDLAELGRLGLTDLKPEGRLGASADYPRGGPGVLSVSAAGLKLNGMELGEASVSGGFSPGELDLAAAEWKIYGGAVRGSGKAAYGPGGLSADFAVKASTMNLAPLLAFAPGLEAREVWLNGESRITLGKEGVKLSGGLSLTAPRLAAPALGLTLDGVKADLSAGDKSTALLKASARRNEGRVDASGRLAASGPDVTILASALPFSHPSGFSGKADAALRLSGAWRAPELNGSASFGESRFDLETWGKYRPSPERSKYYESMSMDLALSAERNAWYRDGANSVEVKAALFFKKEPYRQGALLGTIEALKGYYVYLGNTFTVTSGRMIFNGETPPNPVIEAAAVNEERGRALKIYVNATGTFKVPKLALSADPPMEERDIISFLVTGRQLYELYAPGGAAGAGQNNNGSAAAQNLAASYLSHKAASTLGRKLSIDVINVKVNSDRQPDITVGRYLTKDLFISYGQALGQSGEQRVSAEYSLGKYFSVAGNNSSDGRYVADFLFKFGVK